MSDYLEFYRKVDPASIQAGRNVYVKVSIPIDDFNAALEHYGFVKERTCELIDFIEHVLMDEPDIAELSCGHDFMVFGEEDIPNYCPSCGAKVVK